MSGSRGTFVLVARIQVRQQPGRATRSSETRTPQAWPVPTTRLPSPRTPAAWCTRTRASRPPTLVPSGALPRAGAALGVIFPPAVLGAAAAGGVTGAVSGHLAREMSRSEARQPGDFTGPGQAGLDAVGGSKVEDAIRHAVTRTEKQTAQGLGADPEDLGTARQEPVREM